MAGQKSLFALAAILAAGLALFLAAGGAVVLAALFAGLAGGKSGAGKSGDGGCGDEGEDGFHSVVFFGVYEVPALRIPACGAGMRVPGVPSGGGLNWR